MRERKHRGWPLLVGALALSALILAAGPVAAESRREYVNRYVLLIDWITRAETWVAGHLEDPGLCRAAHSIAERHVELAQRMTPPPEFVPIHPHFLLVIENAERMFNFAASGDRAAFLRYRRVVHEELRLITELLQAEGHFMPVIGP